MTTQAYNLLWISPKFKRLEDTIAGNPFYPPIPEINANSILYTTGKNPTVDVRLWVDSQRLTADQMKWLNDFTAKSDSGNLSIHDRGQ